MVIGIILVITIKPGVGKSSLPSEQTISRDILDKKVETHDTILDLIRNLFPDNIVEMTFREYETKLVPVYKYRLFYSNGTNKTVSNLPANFTGKAI